MPKFTDYAAKTIPDDSDILLIQDASATKKITFLNIFNRVKTKLGLGTLATKNTISQSDLETALADLITEKLTASGIANNLTTTDATKVLSAPQGKNLSDSIVNISKSIGTLDSLTTTEKANLVGAINELVTSLNTLNSNIQNLKDSISGIYTANLSVPNITIDGTVYTGTTEIVYLRIKNTADTRAILIGIAVGASDGAVWSKYVTTNKILIRKVNDGTWTNWTSI